jgi:alkanesulfonate monooxygenase SsuD/methylene tetrahydromethanopterin reductase-like flavin-dependent oxidoreductase (luciferase family)
MGATMKIGIGLPNPVPGTPGTRLVEWARRAEERGFAALSTLDRVVYPSYDSLATLAAAAGATSRIGLATNILIAPVYPPVLLAKATASVDQLSGGRLTLGLAPGGRPDDYAAVGRDLHTRGRDFDAGLDLLHRAWRGEPVAGGDKAVGPVPVNGARIPILFGGTSDQAIRRVVTWGDGWAAGGGSPDLAAPFIERVRAAWKEAGRQGEPRFAALAYYSIGDDATADSEAYLRDYYGFLGGYAEQIAAGALRGAATIRAAVERYEQVGVTELYLDPTVARLDQVDRLADAVLKKITT